MERESDCDSNCNWCARYKMIDKETGVGIIQSTALLRSAKILGRVLDT